MSDVATPCILSYWMVTADWTPWAFFMFLAKVFSIVFFLLKKASAVSLQDFVLFESAFVTFFFLQTIENKAAKHGGAFGLIKLSAFPMCLRPRNKVAFWSVLIQAPLD